MDLEDYWKVSQHMDRINDLNELISEVNKFKNKFSSKIDLGFFYTFPSSIRIKLGQICNEMLEELEKLISSEREKIRNT